MTRLMWSIVLLLAACGPQATPQPNSTPVPVIPTICETDQCLLLEGDQTIKIVFTGPMTGDDASYGIDLSQGARLAVEDASPIGSHNFELMIENDEGDPEIAVDVANTIVEGMPGGIVAVLGHAFSAASLAALPIYEEAGLVVVSASATNPALTSGDSAVFNRVIFNDLKQGALAARYIHDVLGIEQLAVFSNGDAYGDGLTAVLVENYESLGGTVTVYESLDPDDEDYADDLAGIDDARAVYYAGYSAAGANVVDALGALELDDTVFITSDGVFGQTFINMTGPLAEGTYASAVSQPPRTAARVDFDDRYIERFGTEPGVLSDNTWGAYDAAFVIIDAVRAVAEIDPAGNVYIPRAALVSAVRATRDFQGITGEITCDERGECNTLGPGMYVVQDGAWIPVPMIDR